MPKKDKDKDRDSTGNSRNNDSAAKIAALENERDEMANDQTKKTEEINKKNEEINNLKAEIDRLHSKSNVNVDLEAEMERLKKEAEDAKSEASELKAETERLRREADEAKSEVIELIRKQGNPEGDMKVRDLERKIGVLEMREVEENSRRVRVEEEMREKVEAKQREIEGIRLENEEVNKVVIKQNLKIRALEEKARVLGSSNVNGIGIKGLELKWQVVAAGGAVAAVTIFFRSYFGFGKPRPT